MRRGIVGLIIALGAWHCAGDEPTEPPPATGFCDLVEEGTECDDGNPCTTLDRCRGGICTAGDLVRCDATDACHLAGACDPATGVCTNPDRPDGSTCDDQDACTQSDECMAGTCVGRFAVVCRQLDDCRIEGVCDPATGVCSHPAAANGTACTDGDACTEQDECRAGVCIGGGPKDCGEADTCGSEGICDSASGDCIRVHEPDGTACDDEDRCTVDDGCQAGVCTGGDPLLCPSDNPCRVAVGCAADTGCAYVDHADGAPCNDGDQCTAIDHCIAGTCTSTTGVECAALDGCHDAGVCDPSTGCTNPPKPDGVFCDAGDLCTLLAGCLGGVCTASVAVECPDSPSICLADGACNPTNGDCFFPPLANGASCDDANVCTGADVCTAGRCGGPRIPTGIQPCADGLCFTAVTATVGISFTSTASMMMGAGAAFLDYNGDGALDIALGSEGRGVQVFTNAGGSFTDVTTAVGITALPSGDRFMGFAVADYDNDGDDDLYLAVRGLNRLYQNNAGVFVDVTASAGVGDSRWSSGAAFGDYDGDGDLDLYVGNYIQTANFPNHGPYPNALYRNDGGIFTDVGATLGVAGVGTTLAVTWTDFDNDGDADLFVCNDFGAFVQPNQLYRNDGGTFVEVGQAMGFDVGIFCMGIAASDIDGDLDLDYYFTNLGRNVLLRNDGTRFVDVSIATGTTLTTDMCRAPLLQTSWGTGFVDFDQDGAEELYVSNGYVPAAGPITNAVDSPNALFVRGTPFVDVSISSGIDDRQVGRGVAFGDYDNDGDIDILQANVIGTAILYRNDAPAVGGFLTIALEGRRSNRDGFGARLQTRTGTVVQIREANANFGFESSSDKRVHFGLGNSTIVDELDVRWPSGITQSLFDVPAGMSVALREPRVTPAITSVTPSSASVGQTITVVADLTNHTTAAVTVDHALDFTNAGVLTNGSTATRLVAPGATVSVAATVVVPTGASGPSAVTFTVSEAGAVTQVRSTVIAI